MSGVRETALDQTSRPDPEILLADLPRRGAPNREFPRFRHNCAPSVRCHTKPRKNINKSTAKSAVSAGRGSAVKAVSPVVRIGLGTGISANNTETIDQHPDASAIRAAIATESRARWPIVGRRQGGPR